MEESKEDNNKQDMVTICDPVTPIFFPKSPDKTDPIKGKSKIVKYI